MAGTELDLTPTEKRLYAMLQDGERHGREELRACLFDEYANVKVVTQHIRNMRPKLPEGKLIVCEIKGRAVFYRLVYHFNTNWKPVS